MFGTRFVPFNLGTGAAVVVVVVAVVGGANVTICGGCVAISTILKNSNRKMSIRSMLMA